MYFVMLQDVVYFVMLIVTTLKVLKATKKIINCMLYYSFYFKPKSYQYFFRFPKTVNNARYGFS